jgi:hypothetical protein
VSFVLFLKCKAGEFIEIEKSKLGEESPQNWGWEGPKRQCPEPGS